MRERERGSERGGGEKINKEGQETGKGFCTFDVIQIEPNFLSQLEQNTNLKLLAKLTSPFTKHFLNCDWMRRAVDKLLKLWLFFIDS